METQSGLYGPFIEEKSQETNQLESSLWFT